MGSVAEVYFCLCPIHALPWSAVFHVQLQLSCSQNIEQQPNETLANKVDNPYKTPQNHQIHRLLGFSFRMK